MLADDTPGLAQLDPLGISTDLDRSSDRARRDGVSVVVEPHQAGLGHRGWHRVEPVERPGIRHQAGPLRLEHLPDRLLAYLGMPVHTGMQDALLNQPGIQLVVALHPQPRCEEPLAPLAQLVLDPRLRGGRLCPFSRPDAGVQATGSTR